MLVSKKTITTVKRLRQACEKAAITMDPFHDYEALQCVEEALECLDGLPDGEFVDMEDAVPTSSAAYAVVRKNMGRA